MGAISLELAERLFLFDPEEVDDGVLPDQEGNHVEEHPEVGVDVVDPSDHIADVLVILEVAIFGVDVASPNQVGDCVAQH